MKVITYHVVSDEALSHIKHLYRYKSPEMFERDLVYLKENHSLVSYEQLVQHHSLKSEIKPGSIMLTFDDGYKECFSVVRPLLLQHGIPGIFFVPKDFIDNQHMYYRNKVSLCIERIKTVEKSRRRDIWGRIENTLGQGIGNPRSFVPWIKSLNSSDEILIDGVCDILGINSEQYLLTHRLYLTSAEIKLMVSDGFTIGAHGKQHHQLGGLSEDEIEKEIVDCCRMIMGLTGQHHIPFAFPFTGWEIDTRFLKSLISKYKFIKLIFGVQGKDRRFIKDRIWADSPSNAGGRRSNLPRLLKSPG